MAIKLRYNTGSQVLPLGQFVDSVDGNTEKTALTIANTDIKLWKRGATSLVNKNSGGATHMSNGVYYCTLDATDCNTMGSMVVYVHVAGALPVRVECEVEPTNKHDSLTLGTDWLPVTADQTTWSISGNTLTVKKQDGTTTQYTKTLTSGAANPITGAS